ncbi:cupin domain-containing protein [Terriglobus aquaticus]|uniref:Cupin domain-containing protein n=1 Tax=Terriglobus aquaticus TaxID=940139 RepID=A0ABW9KLD3_9BACT|nr:cupin domain-containing protein [Terriglobus aquaticus]
MSARDVINLQQKLNAVKEHWRPHVVAELNGQEVKVVKLLGEFPWHHHDDVDELFIGWRGTFRMEFRDRSVSIGPGQCLVVPRGVEHRPVADQEAEILLFEPAGVRNTGNILDDRFTAPSPVHI